MRLMLELTNSQLMALREIIIGHAMAPQATEVFVDCSTPELTETTPGDLLQLLDAVRPLLEPSAPSSAAPSRLLKKEERRIVTDALRLAAAETRKAKTAAVSDTRFSFGTKHTSHVDELVRLAGTQDRLAAELAEYDIRLERTVS